MAGADAGVTPSEIDIRFGGQHRITPITVLGFTAGGDKSVFSRLGTLYGWSAAETTGAALARARLYDSADASGTVLGNVAAPTADGDQMWMGDHGIPITIGLFQHIISGTMDITVYVAADDPPLRPT